MVGIVSVDSYMACTETDGILVVWFRVLDLGLGYGRTNPRSPKFTLGLRVCMPLGPKSQWHA